MNTTGKILTAFAAGAGAGIVVGILFAPDKGSETRQKISDEGKKIADSFKCGNDVKESIKHTIDESAYDYEQA